MDRWRWRSPTPGSESPPRIRMPSSRNSARWAGTTPASARAQAWGSRWPRNSWSCTEARSGSRARSAEARPSRSRCLCIALAMEAVMVERRGYRVDRREFLRRGILTGAAGWAALRPGTVAAGPPPETTTIRIPRVRSVCLAPQYVAEELLRAEGFQDVQYVVPGSGVTFAGVPGARAMGAGQVDIQMNFAAPLVVALEEGTPIVALGGIHVGCFELIGTERLRTLRDLKGKSVAIPSEGSAQHIFLASILTQIGLDPRRDIRWDTHSPEAAKRLLAEGKIEAFLGFPPDPQELRAKRVGHVLVNSAVDRPWPQYFCCLAAANREFVRKHPVATKRALRALVKASQLCASNPIELPACSSRCGRASARRTSDRRPRNFLMAAGATSTLRRPSATTRCVCTRPV